MRTGVMLTWLLAGAVAPAGAQEIFRLVSAQVVTAGDRLPTLKLSANGPIAYRVVGDDEPETEPPAPGQLRARLYGVTPGEIGTLGSLFPFAVSLVPAGHDTILTVSAAGLPAGTALAIESGGRANEIDVTVRD